jgi:uncharacterized protein YjdB
MENLLLDDAAVMYTKPQPSAPTTTTTPVTGVTVHPASASVVVGASARLKATVSPANATNRSVTWTSSNIRVTTVTPTGVVTGVAAGSATITATTANGGFTNACDITVSGETVNYLLTIKANGNGSTNASIGAHTYAAGTSVSVTATPSSNATVTDWSDAVTGTANPVTVTMDGNLP